MEITTESPLLPWLVRHCGWILSRFAVRADGKTGYTRLKGCENTSGIQIFGEAIWYKMPKTADLTKLDDRWSTAIWLGKSDRSDEHIIRLETGAVLARSFRREVEGKRWNQRALKMVAGTPWNPRPGEVVARRRCRARFDLLCAGEDSPVEARAQEGQPAPPTRSSSTESHLTVNGSTDKWSRHGRDGVRGH